MSRVSKHAAEQMLQVIDRASAVYYAEEYKYLAGLCKKGEWTPEGCKTDTRQWLKEIEAPLVGLSESEIDCVVSIIESKIKEIDLTVIRAYGK